MIAVTPALALMGATDVTVRAVVVTVTPRGTGAGIDIRNRCIYRRRRGRKLGIYEDGDRCIWLYDDDLGIRRDNLLIIAARQTRATDKRTDQ